MNVRVACVGAVSPWLPALSCGGDRRTPPPVEQAALGGEVAARVGTDVIPMSLVIKVAAVQHIAPREALRRLVDDAVTANAARARGLDRRASDVLAPDRCARPIHGRSSACRREARRAADRRRRSRSSPRGTGVRSTARRRSASSTLVAQRPKKPDAAAEARARAFAEQAREAVLSAKDSDEFQAKAKALPHPGRRGRRASHSPRSRGTGDVSEGGEGTMDEAFAKAAFALEDVGATSPVVETEFGWHVIRLERADPRAANAARGAADRVHRRGLSRSVHGAATAARLTALRAATPIEIAPSAELLMRSLVDTRDTGRPRDGAPAERRAPSSKRPVRPSRRPPARDMDATAFARILHDLIARLPGAFACALVDLGGETVDYAGVVDPFDVKVAAAHMRIILNDLDEYGALGEPRWIVLRGERRSFVGAPAARRLRPRGHAAPPCRLHGIRARLRGVRAGARCGGRLEPAERRPGVVCRRGRGRPARPADSRGRGPDGPRGPGRGFRLGHGACRGANAVFACEPRQAASSPSSAKPGTPGTPTRISRLSTPLDTGPR